LIFLVGGAIDQNHPVTIPQNAFEKKNKDIDLLILEDFEENSANKEEDECTISLKLTVILLF
jgi:hypothetical protein